MEETAGAVGGGGWVGIIAETGDYWVTVRQPLLETFLLEIMIPRGRG